ncbi:P-loop containing nucleoside triphosphate hydrolase protein [Annulohypoxylon truncatum]|uniref:P-loop containing nucleoside triphosphate hydrolase protein n=1 Tax=Annulohypoxylon truncatum TaxID=327061 RepID=UPI0020084E59|nr:P-loop containing nucleoside triphosphate hydrolase protein [Annulohypoxylon truncatum]KAI1208295.1 P-loop containing nucleoside triphosphate hydrolase protein [Annulohypoxylon truncatum]
MGRFETPAGRLSTIFYSTDVPRKKRPGDIALTSDEEKSSGQATDMSDVVLWETYITTNQIITSSRRHFAWKDLCLDIQVREENRRLLNNVSGWLEPGTMTALMGVSGAGKLDSDSLPQSMNRHSGFVQQQDVHLDISTVREALRLTAQLRQAISVPIAEKYEYVETVISMLEMEDVADALIGTPGTGLSLEKRKRVSIGVELAAKPDILLFLDEPTSGLDGESAFFIISLMRKLANAGQTILCTIHQPSFDRIEQFDGLFLLIPGGDDAANEDQDILTYAASPFEQLRVVLHRAFLDYWKDPDYVIIKMQLNIWMGLINGLTFLQLSNSMTDLRNRLFSIFIGIITEPMLTLQVEPRFISVFVLSTFLVEIPFNLIGGLLYWLLWYYIVGYFYSSERAGYAFLMYELYQIFVASFAQLISSVFPTIGAAQIATGFVWLMVNTFNGPLSPPPLTPKGWRWFYNVSPLFYLVEGIATNAMHGLDVRCSDSEISIFYAPDNETCDAYAAAFFGSASAQGYLLDANAMGECAYCPYANGDEYLKQYDFDYSHRARNIGIFIKFIMFNYTMAALATYLIFICKWRMPKISLWGK